MTNTFWRKLSTWLLEWAERLYLHAHGWDKRGSLLSDYAPPGDYPFRDKSSYTRSHAVNAQKQLTYNPVHGGVRRDPDLVK